MTKEDVEKQLERVTEDYRSRVNQRNDIRKLCITVWSAILVAVSTSKLQLSATGNLVLLILPVLMFWILEMLQASITTRRRQFICTLEKRLATCNFEYQDPIEIYFESMDQKVTLQQKFSALKEAVVTKETMHLLYLFQVIATVAFLFISKSGSP